MKEIYYSSIQKKYTGKDYLFLNNACISKYTDDVFEAIKISKESGLCNIYVDSLEVDLLYEKFLDNIYIYMNKIHSVNYSRKYWETLIGTWLHFFLKRQVYINKELNNIKDEKYKCDIYNNDEDLATFDIEDSLNKIFFDDYYNALLYSMHLKYKTNIKFIKKQYVKDDNNKIILSKKRKLRQKFVLAIKKPKKIVEYMGRNILDSILKYLDDQNMSKKEIIIRIPYPDSLRRKKYLLSFILKSKFKIGCYYNKNYVYNFCCNYELRKSLYQYLYNNTNNEFEKKCSELISYALPMSYLEGYRDISEKISWLLKYKMPKKIFGVVPIRTNDDFAYYLAYAREYGVDFIDAQHGLNYEFFKNIGINEYNISDKFYTWGSKLHNKKVKIKQCVAWDLKKEFVYNKNNKNILYATTDYGKYATDFLYSNYFSYIFDGISFLNKIDCHLQKDLVFRLRNTADRDWNYKEKVLKKCNWVRFSDSKNKSFIEDLKEAKIFICDDLSTCIAEAFINDVPTIIFLDKKIIDKDIYHDASIMLNKMFEAKLLFYSPEEAAIHLNNIYNNINIWWNSDLVRNVRQEFIENFVRNNENWVDIWVKELLEENACHERN